MDSRNSFLASA